MYRSRLQIVARIWENGLHWSVWPILPVFPYPGDILQSRTVHESVELGPRPNANIAHKIFVV